MNGRLVEEYLGQNEVPNLLEYVKLTMLPETLALSPGSTTKKLKIKTVTEEPVSKLEEVPDRGSLVVWYALGALALVIIAYALLRRRRKGRYSHLPYDSYSSRSGF